jgi:hypothetical protein
MLYVACRRRAAGEELLPEDDPSWKPLPEPSQLDAYLVASQMATYCEQACTLLLSPADGGCCMSKPL